MPRKRGPAGCALLLEGFNFFFGEGRPQTFCVETPRRFTRQYIGHVKRDILWPAQVIGEEVQSAGIHSSLTEISLIIDGSKSTQLEAGMFSGVHAEGADGCKRVAVNDNLAGSDRGYKKGKVIIWLIVHTKRQQEIGWGQEIRGQHFRILVRVIVSFGKLASEIKKAGEVPFFAQVITILGYQ